MRHGNGQSRADQPASDHDREVTAERELLPQPTSDYAPSDRRHGLLGELVSAIWRVLRGMGIADDDVAQATRVSFDHAFAELASQTQTAPSTLAGVPIDHVIDPLFVAAYRAACAEWRPLLHAPDKGEISGSSVRFQGEVLVLGLLGALDEVKRSCLLLADMELLSSPEIAALTGLRLDVVYDELRKARKTFERARKRYNQAGATIDAETDVRELLALARVRFSPAPAVLDGLCGELSQRFEASALRIGSPQDPEPDPESAA
jgi:DNA-directed RNA polymerase specialized sigma24 family protein